MTALAGDEPDWGTLVAPFVLNSSANNVGPNNVITLFSSSSPYRIWGVFVTVSTATSTGYTSGVQTVGAQVGDGSGASLLRCQVHVATASDRANQGLSLSINGYTPIKSGGLYTTNLITDVGFTGLFFRANAGILYSIP